MSLDKIMALIPHRPPMLLIDEILQSTERSIVCQKTFRADEYFVQGHYPDFPLVPGVILLESCCQAGAVLVAQMLQATAGDKVPVLTRVDNAKFKQMVRPGDSVTLEAEIVEVISLAIYLKGKVKVNGKVSVTFDFACSLAPRSV
ncbi:MAG: 3-hydroxyacyl-ACP dehydratase FabZ [Planctomycetaceae bacterium]|jgi:3-hydroxyacyl-[acyl-carrier-protein] dehydratase|nr:3-hydroxyacyl-ACP dehydratase FabZ [Planctomycetaceae bacterium]